MAGADVDADHDVLRVLLDRTGHERRIGRRGGAQDGAGRAGLQDGAERLERSDPSAHLNWDRDRVTDRLHGVGVGALVERGVQVHHVQPPGALLLEPLGDGDGVIGVRGLLVRVAAHQADGAAAAQIDRGDHDHAAFTARTNDS